MQPWSPPENAIVLTDLLRPSPPQHHQQYQPQQQRYDYVKQEPQLVPSRPRIVELPPLLPPRAPMLPAFSDVLRTTSPQHFQHENQETAASVHLYGVVIDKSSYTTSTAVVTEQYPTTFSATFMTRPHAADYHKSSGLVLPSLPATTSVYAITSGDMTPPGLVGARTRPIENVPPSPTSRPANRTCRFAGCTHYVVDHGLCVRHGGGKRCTAEGCTARAKHFGRCWRHGGSVECKAPECCNRAKSRGFCWSHGGGTKCKTGACEKIAISNGLCWAHGGGKRCIVPGCRKQAYERTCNYCNSHFQQYQLTALELARHNPSV
ncbi:hypothetical protein KRP22_014592 [Phytophthora ramorum]|nr:putative WRKY transcription factor 19 [Phytophthora ramorum]